MRGKYLSVDGDYVKSGYKNRLRMRGKYLNVFGECAESIYALMEKTQKGSWRIL
jgi:hypothetical protein